MDPGAGAQPDESEDGRPGQPDLLGPVEGIGEPGQGPGMLRVAVEDGIRDLVRSRGLGDVYKRQVRGR